MKTILITGSSKGIGRALTEKLLAQGDRVLGLARTQPSELTACSHYVPFVIDLAVKEGLEVKFKKIVRSYDIDVVICNAGRGVFKSLEEFSSLELDALMQVNFTSHALLLKNLLPTMKAKGCGLVVCIGSESAIKGAKFGSIYSASKFALRGLCQSLREECRTSGIGVSMVNPGMVASSFYDALEFEPGAASAHSIASDTVADVVLNLLTLPSESVMEECVIQPITKVVRKKKS